MNMNDDSSSAAAEAIRKAKEIAARLSAQTQVHTLPLGATSIASAATQNENAEGGGSPNDNSSNVLNGSGGSHKRKRWGVLPTDEESTKKPSLFESGAGSASTAAVAAAAAGAAGGAPPAVEPITKRVWVSVTEEKPAPHFVAYGKRHIPAIIERLTGEKPVEEDDPEDDHKKTKTNSKQHSSDPSKLSISFQGKGADPHKAVLPGVPEEPLHCRIQGPTKMLVEEAASAMEDVLQEAANAPTDTDAVEAHERALVLTKSLSLDQILSQAANRTGAYRPASVAALIHGGTTSSHHMALPADKLAAALLHGSAAAVTKEVQVPNGLVGYLIGRGGENIARMQALTECKVQIQKEHELQPGQTFRIITLSAATEEAVEECERLIQETVQERTNYQRGVAGGGAAAAPSAGVSIEMDVPDADIGLIIGKMGATIKAIQDESGANIKVPKTGNANDPTKRTLTITHSNEQGANLAKQLIQNTLASKPSYASNINQPAPVSTAASIQVLIPDKDVGLCIGRQGCVIKYMQSTTQCRIQIPPHAPPGHTHRIATVSGPTPEACASVQQMIDRIVQEQSSASVMSGAALHPQQPMGHAQHLQQQQQQQQQQQGYSAEWAAYHAAQQASAQLLEQQQQQQQQQAAAQASVPAAQQQGADAYYEQFFRYAYYYGEDAARQYYGAWSPPPGTPNPYGVNPAGLAPAPASSAPGGATSTTAAAPAPAAAPTPAAPVAPSEAPRETGRRLVSNLPAWMTQNFYFSKRAS